MVRASACVTAVEHGDAEECTRHVYLRVHTLQLVNFWRDPVRAPRVGGGASRRVPGLSYPRAGIRWSPSPRCRCPLLLRTGKLKVLAEWCCCVVWFFDIKEFW